MSSNSLIAAPDVLMQPIQAWMEGMSTQFGFINVNVQATSQPQAEQKIVEDVASYGKQIGRVCDVLLVLLRRMKTANTHKADACSGVEQDVIDRLLVMLGEIQDVKEQANLPRGRTRTLLDAVLKKQ